MPHLKCSPKWLQICWIDIVPENAQPTCQRSQKWSSPLSNVSVESLKFWNLGFNLKMVPIIDRGNIGTWRQKVWRSQFEKSNMESDWLGTSRWRHSWYLQSLFSNRYWYHINWCLKQYWKKILNSHSLQHLEILDCNLSADVLSDPKNANDQRYLDCQISRLPDI